MPAKTTEAPKVADTKATVATAVKKQSKTATVLAMLKEPKGTTIAKIAEVTNWQNHTVRGTLANLKKKKSLNIISERVGDERRYFIQEKPTEIN